MFDGSKKLFDNDEMLRRHAVRYSLFLITTHLTLPNQGDVSIFHDSYPNVGHNQCTDDVPRNSEKKELPLMSVEPFNRTSSTFVPETTGTLTIMQVTLDHTIGPMF